jgi:4-hydroxyacetophenone monooxygenase
MSRLDAGRMIDPEQLRSALDSANIPTLLMTLVQLTGDRRWLHAPYRPTRSRGLGDHPTGGLSAALQADVRDAAQAAISAWLHGEPPRLAEPDTALLREMLTVCVGEAVPDDYVAMVAEQMGLSPVQVSDQAPLGEVIAEGWQAVIIGAGVSGLLAAVRFKRLGIPFVIIERQDDVGGNWLDNRYPGCGVDTPSYLYSYSFYQRDWSTHFARRDEVMAYLRALADEHGLRAHVRFGSEVIDAEYSEVSARWTLRIRSAAGGDTRLEANVLVCAVGLFHTPKIPDLPGLNDFAGEVFHSACWPEGLALQGRRVGVVGTGASAMQIVPAIVDQVGELAIFQRSPQWIAPSEDYFKPMEPGQHWLIRELPFYYQWYRFRLAWAWTDRIYPALQRDPDWPHPQRSMNAINDGHRAFFTEYLLSELAGRSDLQRKALPSYPPFGKRILLDNGWYAALRQPHVALHAEAVSAVRAHGLRTASGVEVELDTIVLCTGFEAQHFASTVDFRGVGGQRLREAWNVDDPRAYLGVSTPGFPNLFFMYGPNTNPIGGSYINIAERQINYIVDLVHRMLTLRLASVDVREDVNDDYNRRVDEIHAGMVWSHPGMETYYRNRFGRVVTNIPWRFVDYWRMTREANLDDYRLRSAL